MNNIITIIGSLTIVNSFVVEFIKTQIYKEHTTLVACITAQVVVWLALYFKYFEMDYVATFVLGLAIWMASTVGFDKVKQVIEGLGVKS